MKLALVSCASIAVLTVVAVAGRQRPQPPGLGSNQAIVHHVYSPLTVAEKLAALKVFGLNQTPPAGGTLITLTPQAPYYAPLDASLNAGGQFSWYSKTHDNAIVMTANGKTGIAVNIYNPVPNKAYLVTFNVYVQGGPVSVVTTTWSPIGAQSPFQLPKTITYVGRCRPYARRVTRMGLWRPRIPQVRAAYSRLNQLPSNSSSPHETGSVTRGKLNTPQLLLAGIGGGVLSGCAEYLLFHSLGKRYKAPD